MHAFPDDKCSLAFGRDLEEFVAHLVSVQTLHGQLGLLIAEHVDKPEPFIPPCVKVLHHLGTEHSSVGGEQLLDMLLSAFLGKMINKKTGPGILALVALRLHLKRGHISRLLLEHVDGAIEGNVLVLESALGDSSESIGVHRGAPCPKTLRHSSPRERRIYKLDEQRHEPTSKYLTGQGIDGSLCAGMRAETAKPDASGLLRNRIE